MSSDLVRWGGQGGVVAGAMYVVTGVLELLAPQQPVFTSFTDYLIEVLFVIALLGTLVAIAGLHALQRGSYGRLGAAGSSTTFIGTTFLLVAAAATTLAGREALDAVFPLGVLATLVGLVLLGAATLRARVLPPWYGLLLIAGFPLSMILAAVANLGSIGLGVLWGSVGYALLSSVGASGQQPSRVS